MYYTDMRSDDVDSTRPGSSLDWESEDFIDTDQQPIVEDDPWSESPIVYELEYLDHDSVVSESVASDLENYLPTEEDEDDENLSGVFEDLSKAEWDEPEPFAEYDSDLSEILHISEDVSDLYRNIKIDELIAGISSSTNRQRAQIFQLLEYLSTGRLRIWLPWLHAQSWTGHSLFLFLDFRLNHWEENPEWWEYTFWHSRFGHWWTYPSSNYNILSLDATYMLVHARLSYPSQEIIDEAWLKDWEDFALWKQGFPSFASFAVFRAEIAGGEDWRRILISNSDYSEINVEEQGLSALYDVSHRVEPLMASLDGGRYSVWEDHLPYRNPRRSLLWFAMQDQYDPAEWHDNLGWPHDWIEAVHPYLLVPSPRDIGTSIRNRLDLGTTYSEDVAEYDRKQVQS